MSDVNEKLKEVCDLKESLMKKLKMWLEQDPNASTEEAGAIVDMIKDLSEVEKNAYEACYYKLIAKAMKDSGEEWEDEGDRYGYNHRHMNNGRFATAGHGHMVYGYQPHVQMDHMMHEYMENPEEFERRMKMGYSHDRYDGRNGMIEDRSRHGESYDGYRRARRHYTESKSPDEKEKMNSHTKMYVDDVIHNVLEMWSDGDPMLRKDIKESFTKLIGSMN